MFLRILPCFSWKIEVPIKSPCPSSPFQVCYLFYSLSRCHRLVTSVVGLLCPSLSTGSGAYFLTVWPQSLGPRFDTWTFYHPHPFCHFSTRPLSVLMSWVKHEDLDDSPLDQDSLFQSRGRQPRQTTLSPCFDCDHVPGPVINNSRWVEVVTGGVLTVTFHPPCNVLT